MRVFAAYIGMILVTATAPLAVQWSGQGSGYLFGITSRMVISTILAIILLGMFRLPMVWTKQACQSYLAAGLGIFFGMLTIHWSAQYIPSGWIAVLYGLAPISTGIMAVIWLNEPSFTPKKLIGIAIGIGGLIVIFGKGMMLSEAALYGVVGILLSVLSKSASAVWVKSIHTPLNGFVLTTGGLLVATPLFLLVWFSSGNTWPAEIGTRAMLSIVYLAVFINLAGFALYYYLLRKIDLTRLELVALIAPVCALLLGMEFNNEVISPSVWVGTLMILSGLACFEFGEKTVSNMG